MYGNIAPVAEFTTTGGKLYDDITKNTMFKEELYMETSQIIAGCIVAFLAILTGLYASFTARGKGPILSNTYRWMTKEQREKADKKAEYRLMTVIFGALSGVFLFACIGIFTDILYFFCVSAALIVFVVIYAIVDSVRSMKNA